MGLPERMKFGIFLGPFHRVGENPTLAMDRDLELVQWLNTSIRANPLWVMTTTAEEQPFVQLTARDFKGKVDPDWCAGCGDFGVLTSLHTSLEQLAGKTNHYVPYQEVVT